MKIRSYKKKPIHNAKKTANPLRIDPTRTATLRRNFLKSIRRQFALLKGRIINLIGDENALGLSLVENYSPDQPRGADGRWGSGVGISLTKAKEVMDKVPGAKWMREKVAEINNRLVNRYGKAQAAAIVASGQAFGWGLTIGGTALTGVPVYVPFSTIVGMVPGAALAELHYQLRGKHKLAHNALYQQLSEEEIQHLGQQLVEELMHVWGTKPPSALTDNTKWQFHEDADKVVAFQQWIKTQLASTLLSKTEEELWKAYIAQGFKKGAGRSFDDVKQSELRRRKPELFTPEKQDSLKDFYRGTKDEFLRSAFGQPESVAKVKLLAGRSFDDLEGVTSEMSTRMSRTLTDGLIEGRHPNDIAKDLADDVDISQSRAETIARTEIIRAHAEGQLDALEDLGVEEVGVAIEWATADDDHVCDLCAPLEGVVLKIDEARGMLPRHPNCRCAWLPANVGEDDKDQKDTKPTIRAALRESVEEEGGQEKSSWIGADRDIAKSRPESIINEFSSLLLNYSPDQPRDDQGRFAESESMPISEIGYDSKRSKVEVQFDVHKGIKSRSTGPIIVDENNQVVDGAHRLEEARAAGDTHIEVKRVSRAEHEKLGDKALGIRPRDSDNIRKGKEFDDWMDKHYYLVNSFCPTGEGGGQDNSCGKKSVGDRLLENPKQAISALGSPNVKWHDVEPAEMDKRIEALSKQSSSRLKREYSEYEDVFLDHQAKFYLHKGISERDSSDTFSKKFADERQAKMVDIESRMTALEGALAKGHGLKMTKSGKWKSV